MSDIVYCPKCIKRMVERHGEPKHFRCTTCDREVLLASLQEINKMGIEIDSEDETWVIGFARGRWTTDL